MSPVLAKLNPDANIKTHNLISSMGEALSSGFGKPESSGWEEFFGGAIIGAFGVPMVRSAKTEQGKFQSPIYMAGGIWDAWRDAREEKMRQQGAAATATPANPNNPQAPLNPNNLFPPNTP